MVAPITGSNEIDVALANDMTIDITTWGRRSGKASRIEIWFVQVEGRIFITGTPGPRDWYANLMADNRMIFHLKESVTADLQATAGPILDQSTRHMVLEHSAAQWYRSQTTLPDLVANAPLVEVNFAVVVPT
jgi:hypothetical protein